MANKSNNSRAQLIKNGFIRPSFDESAPAKRVVDNTAAIRARQQECKRDTATSRALAILQAAINREVEA